jgi:hypothetical protein
MTDNQSIRPDQRAVRAAGRAETADRDEHAWTAAEHDDLKAALASSPLGVLLDAAGHSEPCIRRIRSGRSLGCSCQPVPQPLDDAATAIGLSYHYAAKLQDELRQVEWDLVVIDEAHKLRNAYRPSNRIGQALQWAVEGRRKLLLTATPLQNTLMEIFGLTNFIDPNIFGDANSFRSKYVNAGGDLPELRARLADFCKRTLRKQVLEYVKYTQRRAFTQPFAPGENEQALYDGITRLLHREDTYAIPFQQRHLTVLILRKLLASSSRAIAGTLETLRARLVAMQKGEPANDDLAEVIAFENELEEDILDEWGEEDAPDDVGVEQINFAKLRSEIDDISSLIQLAHSIHTDTKSKALLKALEIGFSEQERMGALRKALIFTESRRTPSSRATTTRAISSASVATKATPMPSPIPGKRWFCTGPTATSITPNQASLFPTSSSSWMMAAPSTSASSLPTRPRTTARTMTRNAASCWPMPAPSL